MTQTVPALHQQSPTDQYWTIIGSDTAATIESWSNYESILACSRLLVIPRGHQQDEITEQLTAIADSVDYLQADIPSLSSSIIRDRVQQALPIDTLVPPGVAAYIVQHGLYINTR